MEELLIASAPIFDQFSAARPHPCRKKQESSASIFGSKFPRNRVLRKHLFLFSAPARENQRRQDLVRKIHEYKRLIADIDKLLNDQASSARVVSAGSRWGLIDFGARRGFAAPPRAEQRLRRRTNRALKSWHTSERISVLGRPRRSSTPGTTRPRRRVARVFAAWSTLRQRGNEPTSAANIILIGALDTRTTRTDPARSALALA